MKHKNWLQKARKELYAAVLSDVLDDLGNYDHSMDPGIRPLDEGLKMAGLARTGWYEPVEASSMSANPYEVEIELVDSVLDNEVLVLGCGDASKIAPWGELLSTASQVRGAAGCITDGLVRDIVKIREMQFAVFHGGIAPLDSKGRGEMVHFDQPVICGGARVAPGDLIFGDADGVIVVPAPMIETVLEKAFLKVGKENHTRDDLRKGHSLEATFRKYGVL